MKATQFKSTNLRYGEEPLFDDVSIAQRGTYPHFVHTYSTIRYSSDRMLLKKRTVTVAQEFQFKGV